MKGSAPLVPGMAARAACALSMGVNLGARDHSCCLPDNAFPRCVLAKRLMTSTSPNRPESKRRGRTAISAGVTRKQRKSHKRRLQKLLRSACWVEANSFYGLRSSSILK